MGYVPTGYKELFPATEEGDGEATAKIELEMVCWKPPGQPLAPRLWDSLDFLDLTRLGT